MNAIRGSFHNLKTHLFGSYKIEKKILVAKIVFIAASVLFGMHSIHALLTLSPIKASLLLGCGYISYEAIQTINNILLNTPSLQTGITKEDIINAIFLTEKTPILQIFYEIAAPEQSTMRS